MGIPSGSHILSDNDNTDGGNEQARRWRSASRARRGRCGPRPRTTCSTCHGVITIRDNCAKGHFINTAQMLASRVSIRQAMRNT